MTKALIPAGYAVVQLDDKRWYPLQIERYYGPGLPEEGYPSLHLEGVEGDHLVSYGRREEAARICQQQAHYEAWYEQWKWQQLTIKSETYPERCSHYLEIIETITGKHPLLHRWSGGVFVDLLHATCQGCDKELPARVSAEGLTIEEGLEDVAQQVYAAHGACLCWYSEQKAS